MCDRCNGESSPVFNIGTAAYYSTVKCGDLLELNLIEYDELHKASLRHMFGFHIDYCPWCGRKLGEREC